MKVQVTQEKTELLIGTFDDKLIYSFISEQDNDVAILCRKNSKYYWNYLSSTQLVWFAEYDTMQEAIIGVTSTPDYKTLHCTPIFEFLNLSEFIDWISKSKLLK
jgi:hypothetical protein